MNELTDEQIFELSQAHSYYVGDLPEYDYTAFARAIIQADRAQRQAEPEDFDTWSKNPYTLVLQKSIAEDFVPKHEQRQAGQEPAAQPVAGEAYGMVDSFLRNNLHDDDYAEYSDALETVRLAATTPPPAQVPEGYRLVPLEPTPAMLTAAKAWLAHYQHMREGDKASSRANAYQAMLAAAPDCP